MRKQNLVLLCQVLLFVYASGKLNEMDETFLEVITCNPEATYKFASALGELLAGGDLICLSGDLGAGKTTFVQGLALGLGIPEAVAVNSPTFTLVSIYDEGRVPLYHFDVYRLNDSSELYDIAFDEYIDGSGVVVVEWGERVNDAFPTEYLTINMQAEFSSTSSHTLGCDDRAETLNNEDYRKIILSGNGSRAVEVIQYMQNKVKLQ